MSKVEEIRTHRMKTYSWLSRRWHRVKTYLHFRADGMLRGQAWRLAKVVWP